MRGLFDPRNRPTMSQVQKKGENPNQGGGGTCLKKPNVRNFPPILGQEMAAPIL